MIYQLNNFTLYIDNSVIERVEDNFIKIYKKI